MKLDVNVGIIEKFLSLYEYGDGTRFRIAYGGRSGAKSWSITQALLLLGRQKKLRILCTREVQNSIKDSVKRLLDDTIQRLHFEDFYTSTRESITGANGTEFMFKGLATQTVDSMKSVEGTDICWVEEGQSVTKYSWDILTPSIRRKNSEIWVSMNPQYEQDETYQRYVINTPPKTKLININYYNNPFLSEVSLDDAVNCKKTRYDDYLNIWEGLPKNTIEGAVYKNEIEACDRGDRFCDVPIDSSYPVQTFWDIGYGDATAIWFAQATPYNFRIIDFYKNNQHTIDHYLRVLQQKGYKYGKIWVPHDAKHHNLVTKRTVKDLIRAAGYIVSTVPNISKVMGINAARTIFPQCYFDRDKCAEGIEDLRKYAYKINKDGGFSREPQHNRFSHAADAFRYLGVALNLEPSNMNQQSVYEDVWPMEYTSESWMN